MTPLDSPSKPKREQRAPNNPFLLKDGRAMISLGPLSERKYCPYSCPFCYVHAGFTSYASLSVEQTLSWLRENNGAYDIIYISGDTDSFAPPRTAEGLRLLNECSEIGTDLLFTTRYAFSDSEIESISNVANKLRMRGKFLLACTSISQINHHHIEPKPIPTPEVRFQQLAKFKALGIPSILAMRPFLPTIDDAEYTTIVDLAIGKADVILGETWYADLGGFLERGVGRSQKIDQSIFTRHSMDFDENGLEWKVYEAQSTVKVVDAHCKSIGIPFFMRSRPAIEWIRKNGLR